MVIEKENKPKVSIWKKIGKRNMILALAVLLIGTAVWLNWSLFSKGADDKPTGADAQNVASGDTDADATVTDESYFSTVQVSRKRARDEALEVLKDVAENDNSDESVKAQALSDINRLALEMSTESNIETLIKGKGFTDCVAVMNGDSVTVIVSAGGQTLTPTDISKINEVVYEQSGILPANIKITER